MDKDLRTVLDEELMVPLWPTTGRALNKGRAATYSAAREGNIPAVKIGKDWRVATAWIKRVTGLSSSSDDTPIKRAA